MRRRQRECSYELIVVTCWNNWWFFILLTFHIFPVFIVVVNYFDNQWKLGFPGSSNSKASTYNAGDPGLIPGLGRSPGEGNRNPLQYSCLENPMDQGAYRATVHGVAESQTWLSDFTFTTWSNNAITWYISNGSKIIISRRYLYSRVIDNSQDCETTQVSFKGCR